MSQMPRNIAGLSGSVFVESESMTPTRRSLLKMGAEMTTMESLRNTGRTTRMLEEAISIAKSGGMVIVAAYTFHDCGRLYERCLELLDGGITQVRKQPASIALEFGEGRINFSSCCSELFDWRTLAFAGLHQDTKQFVDHAAIERKYAKAVEQLHRFDASELVAVYRG